VNLKIASNRRRYRNNELGLGLGSGLDLVFKASVVSAGNAVGIMLPHDHGDNSSLFLDLLLLAIFTFPVAVSFSSIQ